MDPYTGGRSSRRRMVRSKSGSRSRCSSRMVELEWYDFLMAQGAT